MISGIHAIIYSKQAERLREFLRDVLRLPSVDAGHGWLIFALPPAELAVHPEEDSYHELYLMCDDVQATTENLKSKGVQLSAPIADRGWGLVTLLKLPSGDEIGLYQPKHPTAIALHRSRKPVLKGTSTRQKTLAKAKAAAKRAARKKSSRRN
jgi:hypothetical protein